MWWSQQCVYAGCQVNLSICHPAVPPSPLPPEVAACAETALGEPRVGTPGISDLASDTLQLLCHMEVQSPAWTFMQRGSEPVISCLPVSFDKVHLLFLLLVPSPLVLNLMAEVQRGKGPIQGI